MVNNKCKSCSKLISWKSKGKQRYDCKERQDFLQGCFLYVEKSVKDLNSKVSALR